MILLLCLRVVLVPYWLYSMCLLVGGTLLNGGKDYAKVKSDHIGGLGCKVPFVSYWVLLGCMQC